ncbi:MAG: PDZ domain-containing protein [Planctomycetota bacterium]
MRHLLSRRAGPALLAGLLAVGLVTSASRPAAADLGDEELRAAVAAARDRVYPALVNILVVDRVFSQGRERRALSAGSGVIVSPAGHVITNYHVAGTAQRITCKLPTGELVDADIVCRDPQTDLCILALRMGQREDPSRPLPFASIGDSDLLQVGDHVLALGNPQSLSSSITLGIVSNTERVFTSFTGDRIEGFRLDGEATGIFNRWIQHDALILPGNSGGPLANMNGEVVGINTRGGGGVGFAIPAATCRKVLNYALTFGEVRRGWFAVSMLPVAGLGLHAGGLVSNVLADGPAAKAGIKPGDVITSIAGEPVSVDGLEDVPVVLARIADLKPGTHVPVTFERDGASQTVQVEVARMPPFQGEERVFRTWGVSAMEITGLMAQARGWPDTKGVLLRTMRPGNAPDSAKPPLQGGDVILEIDGKPVEGLDGFEELQKANAKSKALAVRFRRDQEDMVTVLDMSERPRRRGSAELSKAWFGVRTQVLTSKVATAFGLEGRKGFRITRVLPATEAEKAGLEPGDILLALDGQALDASELQDAQILQRRIEDMDIGAKATFKLLRDGKELDVAVVLEETPSTVADARSAEDDVLEYKVRELTYLDRVDKELPMDLEALMVADIEDGSWAAVAGLEVGDVLLELQGEPVPTIATFKDTVKRLHEARPERVRFFVRRGRDTTFVFARPDWPDAGE